MVKGYEIWEQIRETEGKENSCVVGSKAERTPSLFEAVQPHVGHSPAIRE